jgi:hypothetical protein
MKFEMSRKLVVGTVAWATLAASGCATPANDIAAAYVSPTGYQGYSCGQLAGEAQEVSSRAVAATGMQNKKATGDAVAMGVGLVVFWPALFFIGGDGAQSAEVARLKGEMQAIETASRRKGCKIAFSAS